MTFADHGGFDVPVDAAPSQGSSPSDLQESLYMCSVMQRSFMKWNRDRYRAPRAAFFACALFASLSLAVALPAEAAPTQIPLVTFFSPSRGDFFTTSQTVWTCKYFHTCAGVPDGDYRVIGLQGHTYNPANPQPAGTVPLYHWFSSVRDDNFLTSHPDWAGNVGDRRWEGGADYALVRIEGYLRSTGTMALKSYWNGAVADNAAVAKATWEFAPPAGYGFYRTEGFLLPPESFSLSRCPSSAPNHVDSPSWQARGNYIDTWSAPADFINGDTVQLTAPADWYRYDYWGNTYPVRGYSWSLAPAEYPAPGEAALALLVRVTTGRMFVAGRGWYEANTWVRGLGEHVDEAGPCILYDATGVAAGDLQVGFNDPNISDNGGWANMTVRQWW